MSNIDPTLPIYGNPTTQSVRDNFQHAHDEITALESLTAGGPFLPLTGGVLTGLLTLSGPPTTALHAATKAYADTKLALAGGVMTGLLTLSGAPTANLHAATKLYVDSAVSSAVGAYLPLAGGTMAGPLILAGDPANPLGAATKQSVDAVATVANASVLRAGDTMTGLLVLSGDPVDPLGATTRQYADTKLALAGGTMTGALRLFGAPTDTTMAATKGYVDTSITTATGAYLLLTGGTLSGTVTFSAGAVFNGTVSGSAWASPPALGATTPAAGTFSIVTVTASAAGQIAIQGGTAQQKRLSFATGTSTRWQFYSDGAAESGSNAGSGFHLLAYDDTGAGIGDALAITRATRLITVAGDPTVALGIATKQYTDTKLALTGGTMTGGLVQTAATGWGIDISSPSNSLRAQSNVQVWGNLNLGQATTNAGYLTYNATAGSYRRTTWQTAGVARWTVDIFGAESGSNAGAAWSLFRFDDTGANLGAVFQAFRDTGLITVSGPPTATNGIATKGYVDGAITGIGISGYLPLSGGTLTGALILAADPTAALGAATKQYADKMLPIAGGSMTGGLAFGSTTASSATDLTRHIALYAAAYGFNVTGQRLNYNMTASASHVFLAGGTDVVAITSAGLTMKSGAITLLADPTSALQAATKQYVDNKTPAGGPFLSLSGGTMTGSLILYADPSSALEAATRRYVDNAVGGITGFLPLSGGTLTGPLTLSGAPTANLHAATKLYVDSNISTTVGAYLPLAGGVMTGLLTLSGPPTANLHAATKAYVDTTAANYLPLSGGTVTGALHVLSTLDSATLTTGVVTVQPSGGGGNALTISVSSTASSPIQFSGSGSGGFVFNAPVTGVADPTVPLGMSTKQYTDSVRSAIPAASAALPLMSGAGAIGVATPYAREDHQHPSDTTRLPLAGGTMTGALILAADPAVPLGAATKAYVDTTAGAYLPLAGGTVTGNVVINGSASFGGIATFNANISQPVASGNAFLTNNVYIGSSTSSAATSFIIDGNASNAKHFYWRNNAGNRWRLWMSAGEPLDGSMTGADLTLLRYADDGATTTNVVIFNRAGPQVQLPAGGASLYLNSNDAAKGNYIQFHTAGVNPPSLVTRSTGTRLLLYSSVGASTTDYAIGVATNQLWYSVPTASTAHVWYSIDQEMGRWSNHTFTFGTNTATTQQLWFNMASGSTSYMRWFTAGSERWRLALTRNESSGNSGSDLTLSAYDDTGALLANRLNIRRSDGLITTYGNLTVQGGVIQAGTSVSANNSVSLYLWGASGRGRRVQWLSGANTRWFLGVTSGDVGDGSQIGADLELGRYNDSNVYIDSCIVVSRATGLMTLKGDPTTGLGAATKQYVDNLALSPGKSGAVVPVAADIPAGQFTVWKNTGDGSVRIYYNDGGTMKSAVLT